MTKDCALSSEDVRFLRAFEACELTSAGFRHREHLRLAYIYLTLHPFEAAYQTMRAHLQGFLAHLEPIPVGRTEPVGRAASSARRDEEAY